MLRPGVRAAQVFWSAVLTAKSILEEVGVNPLKITFRYLCQKFSESSADLVLRQGWDYDEHCISLFEECSYVYLLFNSQTIKNGETRMLLIVRVCLCCFIG